MELTLPRKFVEKYQTVLVLVAIVSGLALGQISGVPTVADRLILPFLMVMLLIKWLGVTDEKTHDSTLLTMGSRLHGRLVLLDLAYFKHRRFALIDENDGYFVN